MGRMDGDSKTEDLVSPALANTSADAKLQDDPSVRQELLLNPKVISLSQIHAILPDFYSAPPKSSLVLYLLYITCRFFYK